MKRCRASFAWVLILLAPQWLTAQEVRSSVQQARDAFDRFEFQSALTLATLALDDDLNDFERALAYEVLGFSFGAMDSLARAVDALQDMIVIDPDREPDTERLPPRLVNLYSQALGQVLVVRHLRVDSASFIAGEGSAQIRFEVSRPSWAITRIIRGGVQAVIDSALVQPGPVRVDWTALDANGDPVAPAEYQVMVTARESRSQYQSSTAVLATRAPVDTLDHLQNLAGFAEQSEFENPPRDWRPLGMAAVYTGLASGTALALENSSLGGVRREVVGISAATLAIGLYLSLRQAEPRPVQSSILYNQLLRQMLADRNALIAQENARRRRQIRLTIVQSS